MPTEPCPNPACDAGRVNITIKTHDHWPEHVNRSYQEGRFVVREHCREVGDTLTVTRYQVCETCSGLGTVQPWVRMQYDRLHRASGGGTRLSQAERARKTLG